MSLLFRRLCDFGSKTIHWLWEDRVPRGGLTVVEGDPGITKSSVTYDIAARVSRGKPMPNCRECSPPASVILLQDEDPISRMQANLAAAGAKVA